MENLYKQEQELLKKVIESEGKDKDYQDAAKRTIERINKEMQDIEDGQN